MKTTPNISQGLDDIENLKFISETHRALHKQRQKYEFQVVFTILSFYVLTTGAILSKKIAIANCDLLTSSVWFLFLLIAVISSAYLLSLHRANRCNIDTAQFAEFSIITVLEKKGYHILPDYLRNRRDKNIRKRWERNWGWQTAIIIFFAVTAAAIIDSMINNV